jgi:hypothetical protein
MIVQSAPGQGSTFQVFLPAAAHEVKPSAPDVPQPETITVA